MVTVGHLLADQERKSVLRGSVLRRSVLRRSVLSRSVERAVYKHGREVITDPTLILHVHYIAVRASPLITSTPDPTRANVARVTRFSLSSAPLGSAPRPVLRSGVHPLSGTLEICSGVRPDPDQCIAWTHNQTLTSAPLGGTALAKYSARAYNQISTLPGRTARLTSSRHPKPRSTTRPRLPLHYS